MKPRGESELGNLTKDFSISELTVTNTGLPNVPNQIQTEKLLYLATYILQPIRNKFGPVVVNSGFRCDAVNKSIGGSVTSQHLEGEAADIDVPGINVGMVFAWVRANLQVGQCIDEEKGGKKWLHVSLPRHGGMNQQFMTFRDVVYKIV
jgi:zinc D-Ala-D-Ala carboxypeptidase